MKKKLLCFSLFVCTISHAQQIFQDDLSSYTVGQALSGQGLWSNSPIAPNVGIGACLPLSAGQPCSGATIAAQTLSYLNYGSSPKSLVLASVEDGVAHPILPIVTGGDFYVGLVLNITTAPAVGGPPKDFLRVINSDASLVTFRLLVKDAGFGYQIGIQKGASNNPVVYTTDLYNYNESVLVILKYSHLPDVGDDVLNAYVNPTFILGEPAVPAATTNTGMDQSGAIDRVAFRLNYNVAASMPTGFAGLVSTSTNWLGLSFLPLGVNYFQNNTCQVSSALHEGLLNISAATALDNVTLNLYSTTGVLLETKTTSIAAGNSQISLNAKLSSGLYILELIENSGNKQTFKLTSN